jgi:DNA-binding GntR family transcriptional regulator
MGSDPAVRAARAWHDDRTGGGLVTAFEVPMTRREAVLKRLRQDIAAGVLPSGTVLKDGEIAARLGVSITPVREAITQLAAEGLVDVSPNRTRKVSGLTQKSALELIDVMELLACAGFAGGVENLTDEHMAQLRRRHAEFVGALDRGDVTTASAAGAEFSTVVVMANGNRELQSLLDVVVVRSLRMLAREAGSSVWRPWTTGYGAVLQRLEEGDRAGAVARYRRIYVEYRAVVEEILWHGDAGQELH